jgi:hypothetical protein
MILGPKGRHQIAGHKAVVWNRLSISRPEGSPLISIPQITLIIFDLVLFTKLEKFILESPFLMMMLLLHGRGWFLPAHQPLVYGSFSFVP